MTKQLDGRTAVVTGGASGIGRGIVEAFVAEGAKVVIVDRDEERAAKTAAECERGDGCVIALGGDVTIPGHIGAAVDTAVERFGTLDIMVNNAGIMDYATPFVEMEDAMWDLVIATNLGGLRNGMREALRVMLPKGKGAIVNTLSSASFGGGRAGTAYTASKHAGAGLTKGVAIEVARHGIRVNGVAPGITPTSLWHNTNVAFGRNDDDVPPRDEFITYIQKVAQEKTPLGRIADPAEIAAVFVFLASDASSMFTGEVLAPDGGWNAQ